MLKIRNKKVKVNVVCSLLNCVAVFCCYRPVLLRMKSPMLSLAVATRLEFLFMLFCLREISESSLLLRRPLPVLRVTASGPAELVRG